MADKELVLVTGASGFVGKWTVVELLRAGYAVRGTVRDDLKKPMIRETVDRVLGDMVGDGLELVNADLLQGAGWADAMAGVTAVIHVATQILREEPEDPDLVVRPALEGTQRVLRAAADAGVKRVIMTSSVATVGYGHGHTTGKRTYSEADFTNLDAMEHTWAYCIGKTKAEQFAWQFCRENGIGLTTVHPGAILGPALDPDASISLGMVTNLMNGETRAMIAYGFAAVDVRDVAALHVASLQKPEAIGERYLAASEFLPFPAIAEILKEEYPDRTFTSMVLPDETVRAMMAQQRSVNQIINDVGNEKHYDPSKSKALLGRDFISAREAVLATARSMLDLGLIKPPQSPAT